MDLGKNYRGRPRLQYINQVIEDRGYQELKRTARGIIEKHRSCYKLIIRLNTAEEYWPSGQYLLVLTTTDIIWITRNK